MLYFSVWIIWEKAGGVVQNRIQELRKAMGGVTQNELADAVNVSRQTIISLENGRYNASLILAHKIAKYFGVTIEELFLFDEEEAADGGGRERKHDELVLSDVQGKE